MSKHVSDGWERALAGGRLASHNGEQYEGTMRARVSVLRRHRRRARLALLYRLTVELPKEGAALVRVINAADECHAHAAEALEYEYSSRHTTHLHTIVVAHYCPPPHLSPKPR